MNTIKFYFPIRFIPEDCGGDPESDYHRLIELPERCPKCNIQFIVTDPGSENKVTVLADYCDGIITWRQLWNLKIKPEVCLPKNDGCFCDKCTEWSPMAVSNLAENKFRCYRCRQNPY